MFTIPSSLVMLHIIDDCLSDVLWELVVFSLVLHVSEAAQMSLKKKKSIVLNLLCNGILTIILQKHRKLMLLHTCSLNKVCILFWWFSFLTWLSFSGEGAINLALAQNRSQDVRMNGPMGAGNSVRMEAGFPMAGGPGETSHWIVWHFTNFLFWLYLLTCEHLSPAW